MPSRVIRASINGSESLSRVSLGANLLFRALLVEVDDYGRMEAKPAVLRSRVFPLLVDKVSVADVAGWLDELAHTDDPKGHPEIEQGPSCIALYTVGRVQYLCFPRWEEHRGLSKRGGKSRFPAPPVGVCADAADSPQDPGGSAGIRGGPRGSAGAREVRGAPSEESRSRGVEESRSRGKKKNPRATRSGRSRSTHSHPPEGAVSCAALLAELLVEVPGARIPRGAQARWAVEIAKMPAEIPELQANGVEPWLQIETAIRFALGPDNLGLEYEVVIRSGRALREKWPKLVAAGRRHTAHRVPSQAEMADAILGRTRGLT